MDEKYLAKLDEYGHFTVQVDKGGTIERQKVNPETAARIAQLEEQGYLRVTVGENRRQSRARMARARRKKQRG